MDKIQAFVSEQIKENPPVIQVGSTVKVHNRIKEELVEGDALPSIRAFANDLKVSVLTIRRVYEELEQEGFIVSQVGIGTFVSTSNLELLRDSKRRLVEQKMVDMIQTAKSLKISKEELNSMMDIHKGEKNEPERFTIVGLWGRYILKPQTDLYPLLPELEDLTMHLAEIVRIKVVPHSLIRFLDGELCYITRRIDRREDGTKFPMEDMCQLAERLTEYKYKRLFPTG